MVGGVEHPPARRILLAVETAPSAIRAASTMRAVIVAAGLARDLGAEVVVCRARTSCPSRGGTMTSEPPALAAAAVDAAADALVRLGASVERVIATSGASTADAVLDAAYGREASMIVVASPSDWVARRALHRLVRRSDLPVLVVGGGTHTPHRTLRSTPATGVAQLAPPA